MPRHREKRILSATPEQLFQVVADVESYPEFLPWVTHVKKTPRDDHSFFAEVSVGYKFMQETYTCIVHLKPHEQIHVEYLKGPFHHLENCWIFKPYNQGHVQSTEVDFFIDFDFSSFFLKKMMNVVFHQATQQMVMAFEERAMRIVER